MAHKGSCHCGKVSFEVDGEIDHAVECNCTHCRRKGYLLWFVDRDAFKLLSPETELATYTFNRHVIEHRFCPTCGCAPVGFGADPAGRKKAAINVRCLDDVDLSAVKKVPFDGLSR